MSLKDKYMSDRHTVFMNANHFGEEHNWNGLTIVCVTDDENALKRKNNNVNDISWDNNTIDTTVYIPADILPRIPVPNEDVIFDHATMRVLQVQKDLGMLTIVMTRQSPKAVRTI